MAKTNYQKSPDSGLTSGGGFGASPLKPIVVTSQGTQSKPVPPARIKLSPGGTSTAAPAGSSRIKTVRAPGASGTI